MLEDARGLGFDLFQGHFFPMPISQDVGLSYRFLRYVDTAFFSLRRKVSSVQEALALLGEQSA